MEENAVVSNAPITQLVCFRLADEEYAVDITNVQEVIRIQNVTTVPQMPDFALGVINIRGNIVPVFDLRTLFQLPRKEFDELSKILVVSLNGAMFSMIVDQILDNIKIETSHIDPAPDVKMKMERECISGLGHIGDRMIIILDLLKVNGVINDEIHKSREKI